MQELKGILFRKMFEDGTMISFDLVSNKQKTISMQTLYMDSADYNKKKSAETLLLKNPQPHTPEAQVGQTSSDGIVSQPDDSVKHYSITENSNGEELSAEQQEYFKDSKVVDELGRLKVMYHGTPNGTFTVFRDGTYFTDNQAYADLYQDPGASSISVKRTETNRKTYAVYLNITKPFVLSDLKARDIYINEYIKGGNEDDGKTA